MPVPSDDWQEEYDGLINSKHPIVIASGYMYLGTWLKRKTDRARRLREMHEYVQKNAPEVMASPDGIVIDIGPGPGEFLEIARAYGHDVLGVDAASGEGGMGLGYLRVSRLMTARQKIPVEYVGFKNWITDTAAAYLTSASFINFRGSFEQCFAHRMHGDHRSKMDCRFIHWKEDAKTQDEFESMFARLRTLLLPKGHVLIHANGSADDVWYSQAIENAAEDAGLELVYSEGLLLRKWRR